MSGLKSGFRHPALDPRQTQSNRIVSEAISIAKSSLTKKKQQKAEEQPYLSFRDYIKQANPKFVFYKHCDKLIDVLQRVVDGKLKRVMVFEPPRHGKLCADETPVLTTKGWTTHGELKPGDYVYSPTGQPIRVLAVSPKASANVRVEISNGEVFYCHENHEWTIYRRKNGQTNLYTIETKAMIGKKGRLVYRLPTPTKKVLHRLLGDSIPERSNEPDTIVSATLDPDSTRVGQCIQVDSPDGLYLIGKTLTVTHNSELSTRLLSSYFLYRHPHRWVSINSYGANLACGLSRHAREYFKEMGGRSKDDSNAMDHWETTSGGGMFAAGVGGPILGKGWHCFPAGTLIRTEIGDVPIETLAQLNDHPKVLSFNHVSQQTEYKKILATASKSSRKFVEVSTSAGSQVVSTADHPFFVYEQGYREARHLTPGDPVVQVKENQGEWEVQPISVVRRVCTAEQPVYDIQVEENSNFFANGILVHNCGIIDDCLKNAEEANSEVIRDKQKDWLETTFLTREEPWADDDPDGAIVIIMQRWHQDDICGYLLQQEQQAIEDGEDTENWHIVLFEAIKEETVAKFPSTCTLEPDWRKPGEALCPERRPLHKLLKIKNRLEKAGKGRYWEALFQQKPTDTEGSIVKKDWIKYYKTLPAFPLRIIQSWDTAQKTKELSDFSVCTTWYVTSTGYYLVDVFRGQIGSPDLIKTAINLAAKWKPHVILIEDKGSGTGLIQHLQASTSLSVEAVQPVGEKMLRFANEAPAFESGRVFVLESAEWTFDYTKEITDAPNGVKDDQCDSTQQFLEHIRLKGCKSGADLF